MHVESARGKQSQRPRKARFHKLVKFTRRVEMGLGSLVVMQPLSVSRVGIDQKKTYEISKSLNLEWDFVISELISGFRVRFQIFR